MSFGPPCRHCGACSYEGSNPASEPILCPFCHHYKHHEEGIAVMVNDVSQRPYTPPPTLRHDIQTVINRHSAENGSDTPDYILAEYLIDCLAVFDKAVVARRKYYGARNRA